jgi:hypothetical protein
MAQMIGHTVAKHQHLLNPERWPALCAEYAEPYIRTPMPIPFGNSYLLQECYIHTTCPAARLEEGYEVHQQSEDNFLRTLECLAWDSTEAANDYLRDQLQVEEFQLLDLDNSEHHTGTWTGKSYLAHACFLSRIDIDCEWNDHDNAPKDEALSFYQATEAVKTLQAYLAPYQAIGVARNVQVVAISFFSGEMIPYTEQGVKDRLEFNKKGQA